MRVIADLIAWIGQSVSAQSVRRSVENLPEFSVTQELFCQWNAERLGIRLQESRLRLLESWKAVPGGHGGKQYRKFCETSHQLFRVFIDDSAEEVYDAYRFHAPMHFLRMLSYAEPVWEDHHPVVSQLRTASDITILDFGCGLAQRSRSLVVKLIADGRRVTLSLADIPTLRKEFLLWLGERTRIPIHFLDCFGAAIPELPPCHLCIATDIFEHLHNPVQAVAAIDQALLPGGLLVTDVHDHKPEYMHVSTDLSVVRTRLAFLGYQELDRHRLYRKKPA